MSNQEGRERRRAKTKKIMRGTSSRPRLVVFRSRRYFYGQLIDDVKGITLVSVNKQTDPGEAGKMLAEKALKKKIKKVVFDRAGYKYHGKIKKFADAARLAGLSF